MNSEFEDLKIDNFLFGPYKPIENEGWYWAVGKYKGPFRNTYDRTRTCELYINPMPGGLEVSRWIYAWYASTRTITAKDKPETRAAVLLGLIAYAGQHITLGWEYDVDGIKLMELPHAESDPLYKGKFQHGYCQASFHRGHDRFWRETAYVSYAPEGPCSAGRIKQIINGVNETHKSQGDDAMAKFLYGKPDEYILSRQEQEAINFEVLKINLEI